MHTLIEAARRRSDMREQGKRTDFFCCVLFLNSRQGRMREGQDAGVHQRTQGSRRVPRGDRGPLRGLR